jgi:hypothetical protein
MSFTNPQKKKIKNRVISIFFFEESIVTADSSLAMRENNILRNILVRTIFQSDGMLPHFFHHVCAFAVRVS